MLVVEIESGCRGWLCSLLVFLILMSAMRCVNTLGLPKDTNELALDECFRQSYYAHIDGIS